jgi:hypothetical protein
MSPAAPEQSHYQQAAVGRIPLREAPTGAAWRRVCDGATHPVASTRTTCDGCVCEQSHPLATRRTFAGGGRAFRDPIPAQAIQSGGSPVWTDLAAVQFHLASRYCHERRAGPSSCRPSEVSGSSEKASDLTIKFLKLNKISESEGKTQIQFRPLPTTRRIALRFAIPPDVVPRLSLLRHPCLF